MGAPDLDWLNPDYSLIFEARIAALERLRAKPELLPSIEAFYKDNPVAFINDWGMTFDPRNAEIGKPTMHTVVREILEDKIFLDVAGELQSRNMTATANIAGNVFGPQRSAPMPTQQARDAD